MTAQHHARPVQLQINNSGAWKTVIRFDAGDEFSGDRVQQAVDMLGEIDGNKKTTWRIATTDSLPCVLLRWSAVTGWIEES